jgi:hypothetical protein
MMGRMVREPDIAEGQFSTLALIGTGADPRVMERVRYEAYGRATHHFPGDFSGDRFVDSADEQMLSGAWAHGIGVMNIVPAYDNVGPKSNMYVNALLASCGFRIRTKTVSFVDPDPHGTRSGLTVRYSTLPYAPLPYAPGVGAKYLCTYKRPTHPVGCDENANCLGGLHVIILLLAMAAAGSVLLLWGSRVPGSQGVVLFLSCALVIAGILLVAARWREYRRRRLALAACAAMVVVSLGLAIEGVPKRIAFQVSHPRLLATADGINRGLVSPDGIRGAWIGIYHIRSCWTEEEIIYFRISGAGAIMAWGLAYVPGELPASNRRVFLHVQGSWYYFSEYAG